MPGRPFKNAILSLLGRSYRLMRQALQADPATTAKLRATSVESNIRAPSTPSGVVATETEVG